MTQVSVLRAEGRCQREVPTVSADGTSVPGPYGKGTSRLEVHNGIKTRRPLPTRSRNGGPANLTASSATSAVEV